MFKSDIKVIGGRRTQICLVENNSYSTHEPLVSIITVVFNGSKTIERAIESVLRQDYKNIEHIIVDGGSTDGTQEILKKYKSQIEFWVSEKDAGIYNAMNKGISFARGEYYIPLGCDDELLPNGVSILVNYRHQSSIVRAKVWRDPFIGDSFRNYYSHSAGVLIKKDLHELCGMYDESFRIAADSKFLEIAKNKGYITYIDSVVGIFYPGGASGNYRATVVEHARAMYEAGSWSRLKSFLWLKLRILLCNLNLRK